MRRAPIDARFLASLGTNYFPLRVRVQSATQVKDSYGQTTFTWGNVTGMVGIPAIAVPASQVELKGGEYITTDITHNVMLNGYFPSIDPKMRVLADDGNTFDETGVQHDPWHTWTQLKTRILS